MFNVIYILEYWLNIFKKKNYFNEETQKYMYQNTHVYFSNKKKGIHMSILAKKKKEYTCLLTK